MIYDVIDWDIHLICVLNKLFMISFSVRTIINKIKNWLLTDDFWVPLFFEIDVF